MNRAASSSSGTDQANQTKESSAAKVETKGWSPIDTSSSLVPRKTEYGNTIGNVQLSEKTADYLDKLKSKFHNMEFITVSKDMKAQVQQNAAAYGNANKMVVLIDDEKLERMATDESYRKKYEGDHRYVSEQDGCCKEQPCEYGGERKELWNVCGFQWQRELLCNC